MSTKTKTALQINLEYYPVLICTKIARLIPLVLALIIGKSMLFIYYLFAVKRRKRTISHILHAGIVKTQAEAAKLTCKNFMEFGKTIVEIIKMKNLITHKNVDSKITVAGEEKLKDRFLKHSTPAIIVTAHFGNWELGGNIYFLLSNVPLLSVIRPMSNPKLQKLFYLRDREHHDSCMKKGAMKPLLKALKSGKSIAVMVDQHATKTEGVETIFLGQPARTHKSPAILHIKTGIPILVIGMKRTSEHLKYEFMIEELIQVKPSADKEADTKRIAQLYTDAIERMIRKAPEQWLWAHRRWLNLNR